jgi:FkbM family methyltransferase
LPSFQLRGLTITLPKAALRGSLEHALSSGLYEHQEANALLAHLEPGDRFLDLGAGIGFLCALAARVLGAASVAGVEAGPETVTLARETLAANGFAGVRLIRGAVVGEAVPGGEVAFGLRPAFWASALQGPEGWPANARVISVPARPIGRLLAKLQPTVICCDIEGAELEVLTRPLPGVRLVVVELHPPVYGEAGIRQIGDALAAQGFSPEAKGAKGATVVFRR